jgi:hypothetical protein
MYNSYDTNFDATDANATSVRNVKSSLNSADYVFVCLIDCLSPSAILMF